MSPSTCSTGPENRLGASVLGTHARRDELFDPRVEVRFELGPRIGPSKAPCVYSEPEQPPHPATDRPEHHGFAPGLLVASTVAIAST